MKVRHQIMILLAVPIVCQLLTVLILLQAVGRVDEAVRQEQNAKEIIASGHEIDGLIGRAVLGITADAFAATDNSAVYRKLLRAKWTRMKKLVAGNKQATIVVDRLDEELSRFLLNLSEMSASYSHGRVNLFLAQFYSNDEFVESMTVNFDAVTRDSEQLIAIYRPMTEELRPEAVKSRSDLRLAVSAVLLASVVLVSVLAALVNKQTLVRLQTLMGNIRAFSRAEKTLATLKGKDELAELDQAFREMAQEKFRLDEIQNSLRAMVSHDLRTPLTSIAFSLEMILDWEKAGFDEKTTKTLRRIQSEIQRLFRLARTLLDIEKLEGGNIIVDVSEMSWQTIVHSSIAAVSALADRKDIHIEEMIPEDSSVNCDEDRTIQCVVNLLSNAIKFSPKGSQIKLNVCSGEGDWQRLEVIDQGTGVPESMVGSLFNKFVQLDQPEATKKEGTGLGLYICRLLIEAQGGRMGYCSTGGIGSCFYLELPIPPRIIEAAPGSPT